MSNRRSVTTLRSVLVNLSKVYFLWRNHDGISSLRTLDTEFVLYRRFARGTYLGHYVTNAIGSWRENQHLAQYSKAKRSNSVSGDSDSLTITFGSRCSESRDLGPPVAAKLTSPTSWRIPHTNPNDLHWPVDLSQPM